MAATDGTDYVALPEEKVARRLLRDLKLSPPVAIRKLVERYADIEEDDIPARVDAILLDQSRRRARPLIVLQRTTPPTRKVFTLAHELGHIILPWQCGTFALHTDSFIEALPVFYDDVESEANRFASEILMPRDWILELTLKPFSPVDVVKTLKKTGVSTLAACFGLIRHLPAGYVFAEVNSENMITYSARSPGTVADALAAKSKLDPSHYGKVASETYSSLNGPNKIYWWHLADKLAPPPLLLDVRSSREVLVSIYDELGLLEEVRKKLDMSIAGIVGHSNGIRLNGNGGDLYTIMKTRFLGRESLRAITNHPDFEVFLSKKAEELNSRPLSRFHAERSTRRAK